MTSDLKPLYTAAERINQARLYGEGHSIDSISRSENSDDRQVVVASQCGKCDCRGINMGAQWNTIDNGVSRVPPASRARPIK